MSSKNNNKNEKNKLIGHKEISFKYFSSISNRRRNSNQYNNFIKELNINSSIHNKKRKSSNMNSGFSLRSNKEHYKSKNSFSQNGLTLQDSIYIGPLDKNKKVLRSNDIKSYLSNSTIYQPKETKYKLIEKNIQSKLLDISMELYKNKQRRRSEKNDDSSDSDSFENKSKKTKKPNKKIALKNFQEKSRITWLKARNSVINKSQDTSFFIYLKDQQIDRQRKIRKTKALYDSMAEDESDEDFEEEDFGLNPESPFITIFDFLLLISSLFCLFYIPYQLAKEKLRIDNNEYFIIFMIFFSEIIYAFDLMLGFFRWYYNNELKLVKNKIMILKNYFYRNFFFDFIEAIPFYLILRYMNSKTGKKVDEGKLYNEKYILLKLLISLKGIKIFKINNRRKNRAIYYINQQFSENYISERIYQITNLVVMTLSVLNIFICFHIYIGKLSYPNWIISTKVQNKSFIDIYLASLYFIMATMTSVGYGDIVCISKEETIFQIILLSIGIVAYSWIINTVSDYVKNESKASIKYNKDMMQLEEIRIAYPNMPFKLYNNIKQHLQRSLRRQEKFDTNILINSLPYALKNNLLLTIHKEIISKFIFFKGCENSDFIIKVLTHFIPLYSKKNTFLIKEGEKIENIFFVKDGRLTLEAAIDLDDIEKSIEKYLEYQFEEISSIEESNFDNSFHKLLMDDKDNKPKIHNHEQLLEVIKKLSDNIVNKPYLHETNIEDEIGKCDFNEAEDFEKGNHQFLHILDVIKNEHFGEVYMFLNRPSPLSLRVKSKKVDLFLLRKKDANNIKKDYPNIWKRINDKEMHNMKSIKCLTKKVINRYCKMNGIILTKEILERSNHLFDCKESYKMNSKDFNLNSYINKTLKKRSNRISKTGIIKKEEKKNFSDELNKLSPILKKRNIKFQTYIKNEGENNIKEKISNNSKESKNSYSNSDKKVKKNLKDFEENNNKGGIKENLNDKQKISKKAIISFRERNKSFKVKRIPNNNKNDINKEKGIEGQNNKRNDNNNIFLELSDLKEKHENNNISSSFLTTNNIHIHILNNENSIIKNNNSNSNLAKNITSNSNLLYQISELNNNNHDNKIYNSTSVRCTCTSRDNNILIEETPIKIEYISNYKNINKIAKGKYINDKKFQNVLHKFIKFYLKLKSKKEYDSKNSNLNFSSIELSLKNNSIFEKSNSNFTEKNENFNRDFSKEIEIPNNMNIKEENNNKNKNENKIYKNKNKIHKTLTFNNYYETLNNNDDEIKYNSYSIRKEKNIFNKYSFTKILKSKSNNIKILKNYNFKNDLDKKYIINDNDNTIKNKMPHKDDKYNIVRPHKIFNFNFHIFDNKICLNNRNNKSNFKEKLNYDKIEDNSSNHVINRNLNNIINETNYNYTKNYCVIY